MSGGCSALRRSEQLRALAHLVEVVAGVGDAVRVGLDVSAGGRAPVIGAAGARARAGRAADAETAELPEQLAERLGVRRLGDVLVLVEVRDRDVERDGAAGAAGAVLD